MAFSATATSPESRLAEVLGGLRMLVAQLRLYPKTSPQVAKVSLSATPPILAFLENKRALTIAAAPEGLLVNAVRFPADDAAAVALESSVLALLRESSVKSFTFRAGLSGDELVFFLHSLAHKFWDLRDGKKINLRLRDDHVLNAVVDEVEYVELSKDDVLLKDAAPKLEASGFDIEDLLKTIDERLEAVIEHGKGTEARLEILKRIIDHDPSLLAEVVRQGVTTPRLGDAPGLMTFDQSLEAVRRIWKSMAVASPELRETLRGLAEAVLEPFRGNSTLTAALAEKLSEEAPELIPDWMLESAPASPPEPHAVRRAMVILSLSPEARAEALFREGRVLIQDLVAFGRQDLAEKILTVEEEALESGSSRRKSQAAETLKDWFPALSAESLEKPFEALLSRLAPVLDRELDAPVYAKLLELAGLLVESRIKPHGASVGIDLLETIKRHSSSSDPSFPDRAGLARDVLSRFQPASVPTVAISASSAERVAQALHAASIQFLIAQMKDMENAAERLELAETVARMGSNAAGLLAEELKKTKIPSEAIRLLEVLPWVAEAELAEETLIWLLSHPVVMVRRRAAFMLVERKYARTGEILRQAFETKDPATKIALAEPVGKMGTEAALSALRSALESRDLSDEVRSACAIALAHAGDVKTLPILLTLASPPNRGLTRIFRSVNPVLRAGATKALGSFTSNTEVRSLLERLASDADELVKAQAKEALRPPRPKASEAPPAPSPEAEPAPSQEIKGFSGLVSEISLDHVCQMIARSRMTGLLLVNFEGPTAKIFFDKGMIVAADFEKKKDQDAFNAFFLLKQGAFVFKPGERTLEPRVKAPVDQVLIAAFAATRPSAAF